MPVYYFITFPLIIGIADPQGIFTLVVDQSRRKIVIKAGTRVARGRVAGGAGARGRGDGKYYLLERIFRLRSTDYRDSDATRPETGGRSETEKKFLLRLRVYHKPPCDSETVFRLF